MIKELFIKKETETPKEEMEYIADDEFTKCKCLNCGYEQNIPSWLIDEICEMNDECDLDDHFISGCYRCNQDTMVTMSYYNKVKK